MSGRLRSDSHYLRLWCVKPERNIQIIVTSLAIGGALATSVKVYRDKKRERDYPWTVYAEKMEKRSRKRKRRKRKKKDSPFASAAARKSFVEVNQSINALFNRRSQQLSEISSGEVEIS